MNGVATIARKELRSFFLSPVALIFLGVFLAAVFFNFFFVSKFFARNLADVRPLFNSLPLLLIFLVAALTMRQWSEEQKSGTLELLLTLPLRTWELVLGKFIAGVLLVALALALTLPLPITVSMLGELDWGPVIGGYLAALLLGSTYLALGLCISALTNNQIVALLVTGIIGGVMYLIGHDAVAGTAGVIFGNEAAELLRGLGTGSRFSSIERGVVDLRDLFYYGSLTGFFLALNGFFLETKRMEAQPADGDSRRPALLMTVVLAGANVLVGNLWLAPVTAVRADLTADGEYSISEVTEDILTRLDEPLTIAGYFSEKTHPLLAPLIPRIRDFLVEYEVRGGGNVRVTFADPTKDTTLEEEINEQYGIKSVPFRVSGRNEEAVVNSFFHILVKYGDEYQVLSFGDLIEVHADDVDVQVRLRNLEYDITRAIKKSTQGFQSIEAVLARNEQTVKLTAYVSGETLPEEFKAVPGRIEKVAKALGEKSGGRLTFEQIDPSKDPALASELMRQYGFQPMAVDLFGQQRFWLYLLLQAGDRSMPIFPQGDMGESDLRTTIESGVQRMTPGFVKTIGLISEKVTPEAAQMQMPGMPDHAKPVDYQGLERALAADFDVRRLDLKDGSVPGDIDVLLVAKPGDLDEKAQFAIDQYLMRGGAVLALAGAYRVKPERAGILAVKEADPLFDLLASYGVKVEQAFAMDPQNTAFPIPVREQRGPFTFERIELLPYPFFPDIRTDGFNREHVALAGVPSVALTWSSPVRLAEDLGEGVDAQVLVKTSPESWVRTDTSLEPDLQTYPGQGFGVPEGAKREAIPLAVTLVGTLKSHFADKPSPVFATDAAPDSADLEKDADRTGRTLKQSTPDARLVVVGSSEFVGDLVTQFGGQIGGGSYRGNPVLLRNLIDWTLEDTELLQIRSAGAFARTLKPMEDDERNTYEAANYIIVLFALAGVLIISVSRRRMARPIPLDGSEGGEA